MKNHLILLAIVFLLISCNHKKLSHLETVIKYYQAHDNSDFRIVKELICDSISMGEGDYSTLYSQNSFYELFKWDSIFQPTYKLINVEEANSGIIAIVSSGSLRYEFLKNNPLTCKYKFYFESDKISNIEVLECPNSDWVVWQRERDSLVNWTSIHHSELDGFIHNLTEEGALNYLKAIELYRNRKG
ncbi:hypothetical protein [Aestuariivivens insulae]|uniref:hypothetical protein n=1 Tax=Aestuariivivens insulae TaxID=1621988 RepID=UPI001F566EC9|nr:hypothetical protein [Aestuariivivens insulae]